MQISFHYNWPPAMNSVRISFGLASIQDQDLLFRVGVIEKDDRAKILWIGSGWMLHGELSATTFDVERGDTVVVEREDKAADQPQSRTSWDTNEEWPSEAEGGSTTHVPYTF
jgi:hypothetical protein